MMNHYELLYIIPLVMGEDRVEIIKNKVDKMLTALGAEVTMREEMGKRKLAYPIKQVRYGYYILLEFNLEPTKLKDLERDLRLSTDILRWQVISKQIKSAKQLVKEKALQEKLRHLAQTEQEEKTTLTPVVKETAVAESTRLDELDKKLEEILENEIVK